MTGTFKGGLKNFVSAYGITKSNPKPDGKRGLRLRLQEKAADANDLALKVESWAIPTPSSEEAVVQIAAAGVNPSDVKAAMGMMAHAVFPRTPGRDFAGIVVDGPSDIVGQEVFGSSGDLGIRRDGTHASHLVVEADGVVMKPASLTAEEAAGIGVPFVTAMEGFRRSGLPKEGETVLILGVNGKVGQAAAQIASWLGAKVIGIVRRAEAYHGHAQGTVEIIDSSSENVEAGVRQRTNGQGADIVFNTVGEPYYEAGTKALAVLGRQIFIASTKESAAFDIFSFYRGRHTYIGIDTLALSTAASAELLRSLLPGFESGALKPFPIAKSAIFSLDEARAAYSAVLKSAPDRILLRPRD